LALESEETVDNKVRAWLDRHGLWSKLTVLVRYAFAGGLTTLVYFLVYNGALLVYSKGDPSSVSNAWIRFGFSSLAFGCALLLQYGAHGRFTFGHRQTRDGQLQRYLLTVAFGLLLAASVSAANYNLYVLPDAIVAIITSVLVTISNFILFNFWVYANDPRVTSAQGGQGRVDGP
jgi:putative flippase GtrA